MQIFDDFQNNMQQSYVWGATGIITSEVDERPLSSLFLFATGLWLVVFQLKWFLPEVLMIGGVISCLPVCIKAVGVA